MEMLKVTSANSISCGQTLQSAQTPTTGEFDMHRWDCTQRRRFE